MKTKCVRIKLKPDCMDLVRNWQEFILSNKEEAISTLEQEGVILEAVFLDTVGDDSYLIYVMSSNDFEKAKEVVDKSQSFVDEFHQKFKEDCWEDGKRLETLVELYCLENLQSKK